MDGVNRTEKVPLVLRRTFRSVHTPLLKATTVLPQRSFVWLLQGTGLSRKMTASGAIAVNVTVPSGATPRWDHGVMILSGVELVPAHDCRNILLLFASVTLQ